MSANDCQALHTSSRHRATRESLFIFQFWRKKQDELEVTVSSESSQRLTTKNTQDKIEDTTLLNPKEILKSAFSHGQHTANVQLLH